MLLRCCLISMLLVTSILSMVQTPVLKRKTESKEQQPQLPARPARKSETFWQKVLRITGISVMPGALKGDDDALTGDVWVKDLPKNVARRLTRDGRYRSPLVLPDEQTIWALKGETIIEIPMDSGTQKERFTITGIIKLAGVDMETRKQILLLREDEARQTVVELLSLTDGKRIVIPYNPAAAEDQRMLAYLRGWERSYEGGKFMLTTRSESKVGDTKIEWHDVYLQLKGQEATNVSRCDGVNCGQPSLSAKQRFVVYLKATQ